MDEHDEHKDRLIPLPELMRRVGLSKNVVYTYIAAGDFPAPRKLPGGRAVRWLDSEIDAWMAALPRATGDLGRWGKAESEDGGSEEGESEDGE